MNILQNHKSFPGGGTGDSNILSIPSKVAKEGTGDSNILSIPSKIAKEGIDNSDVLDIPNETGSEGNGNNKVLGIPIVAGSKNIKNCSLDKKNFKLFGFSLAEIMVTMTIIGVVAALTIPSVTANHRKTEAEVKLKKFYTIMTQAIELSENEHDSFTSEWDYSSDGLSFYDTYLGDYLTSASKEGSGEIAYVGFNDGSGMSTTRNGSSRNISFYTKGRYRSDTRNVDIFKFKIDSNGFDVANFTAFDDIDSAKSECLEHNGDTVREHDSCLAWIKLNGWKIPDDYPYDF